MLYVVRFKKKRGGAGGRGAAQSVVNGALAAVRPLNFVLISFIFNTSIGSIIFFFVLLSRMSGDRAVRCGRCVQYAGHQAWYSIYSLFLLCWSKKKKV